MAENTSKKEKNNTGEFAIIETGGKQYKAVPGGVLKIEKLSGDLKEGDKIVFDKVLLVDNGSDTTVGTPFIEGAKVEAVFQGSGREKKIEVIKYKQKSRYFKRIGHRQQFMKVKVEGIK